MAVQHVSYFRTMPTQNIPRDIFPVAAVRLSRTAGVPAAFAPTLVIADPNPWVRRELVRSVLPHLEGKVPGEARSPAEVLMQIANPDCKVLVVDPCMPTLGQTDGMPLLRQICCLRSDLLILVLAQQPLRVLQDRELPAQIRHVYAKTVNPVWLGRFISQALREGSTGVTPQAPDAAR
ncbi:MULTISPECIES: hypothetical protein [Stenotrophomonas]|uniref:hypothetical protein n=1 Tax=Stenotrophomonas TaxID=40323 RepID=UPI0018D2C71D|nr:hypothetical protein [Stenotrophomonas sp.]MBH1506606.1 hypothetical protein [Stenotrophomonas maltophilia]